MNYKALIEKEISFLRNIPIESVEQLVDLIDAKHSYGKVASCGMGKAGQIAHTFATTLSSTGTPAFFIHPAEAQHGDLGILSFLDIIVVFSNSGKTREVIEFINLCKSLHASIKIYAILGDSNSEIESLVDFSLVYGPVEEIDHLGLVPTTSTTCMSVICDLIVSGVMKKLNFTKAKYSKLHHGGYLGTKSKQI